MADVTINNNVNTYTYRRARCGRVGIYWTTTLIGYLMTQTTGLDLYYQKTDDGGANWGAAVAIAGPTVGYVVKYDCWADWETPGDAGTKIHIIYESGDLEQIRYVYLDTDGDSVGGDDLIETCQGTGTFNSTSTSHHLSITKTRGGNLAVAFAYTDTDSVRFESFYTSPDADAWTSKAIPWEVVTEDSCALFPANLADDNDLWGLYWDFSADELSLKTFDDSNNDWTTIAEASIASSMYEHTSYTQASGVIRYSDGHLLVAAWNYYDNAAADLMTWDITDGGTITAKTNILTNQSESLVASSFYDQEDDNWYVTYCKGGTAQSSVTVYYQLSQDGGANWDGEKAMQANAADDERMISSGAVKAAWGGKYLPVWFNDDENDLFCNTDNAITIAASAVGLSIPIAMHHLKMMEVA